MNKTTFILGIIIAATNCALSTTLFFEDFETDLSHWTGRYYGAHNGIIVNDPLRAENKVLSFTGLGNGGDVFHKEGIHLVIGKTYAISVDYLGLEIPNVSVIDNYGGFFGLSYYVGDPYKSKTWLFGTRANYSYLRDHLIDDGQWHTYTYTFEWQRSEMNFPDDYVYIMMEDWVLSGGTYGDVFFDNIKFLEIIPLSILSPNGGETYPVGATKTISWESEGEIVNVQLDYSIDNGSTWNPISIVENTGSYTWVVPNTPSTECLIKILNADDPKFFDISDIPFTIYECQKQLLMDANRDCYVNLYDLAVIALEWLECGNPFDPDCDVVSE